MELHQEVEDEHGDCGHAWDWRGGFGRPAVLWEADRNQGVRVLEISEVEEERLEVRCPATPAVYADEAFCSLWRGDAELQLRPA